MYERRYTTDKNVFINIIGQLILRRQHGHTYYIDNKDKTINNNTTHLLLPQAIKEDTLNRIMPPFLHIFSFVCVRHKEIVDENKRTLENESITLTHL